MSARDPRQRFLYDLPSSVLWEFCRVMDGLSHRDWTRFASEVLKNQTDVRLAERRELRTDWVMNHLENRNEQVGYLVDVLERVQLLRPRDILLGSASSGDPSHPPPPLPPLPPPPSTALLPHPHPPSDPALTTAEAPPSVGLVTQNSAGGGAAAAAAAALPLPDPPPSCLRSRDHLHVEPEPAAPCSLAVMSWPYEEVHAGTEGFSPALQVGEGGFGVVYRATLRNTDCAVKRLKEDCLLDRDLLKKSFQTELEKLCRFRHPNIVNLLGFSEGGGSMCLIYSYMHNRSLDDQLHNVGSVLSWSQRVGIMEGAAAALQFLHSPSEGQKSLIHGDVKSSNILLNRHMVAKLSDFGLARFTSRRPSCAATTTASIGKTETVRGTLAYLPEEYVVHPAVDVFSFGVVLLEMLTGRRALETDGSSRARYLKDLVEELEEGPSGSSAEAWTQQVDKRLTAGGAAVPPGALQVATLACKCLKKHWKKRATMLEVFDKLKDVHNLVRKSSSSSSSVLHPEDQAPPPGAPRSLDSTIGALAHKLSKLGPLEDTYASRLSSSFSSLPTPHPLHSASSLPPTSSASLPPLSSSSSSSSSFVGPCETDESRGFSQYNLSRSNESGCRSQCCRASVPPEDQGQFPPSASRPPAGTPTGGPVGPGAGGQTAAGLGGASPAGSLRCASPADPVLNPRKQRLLEKTAQYEAGRIQTPQLLSSEDLYGGRSFRDFGGPEESDELDFLPVRHN